MTSRGQRSFADFPSIAAKLYDSMTRTRAIQCQYREIAADLASRIESGRILDVGTGPGRLLAELRQLNPAFELYGLDISASMVELARRRLSGLGIDIRLGDMQHSGYDDNFFDIVTCTGSFYLWDAPQKCLEEVFRILKPGQSAYLFESYRDCDQAEVRKGLKTNLKGESLVRRVIAPCLFRKQLGMTYRMAEVATIIQQTRFARSHAIDRIRLAQLPAWLRIRLTKEA
jgi:ubiquinone/menaquinone biosynthesis C-methylase UbiE